MAIRDFQERGGDMLEMVRVRMAEDLCVELRKFIADGRAYNFVWRWEKEEDSHEIQTTLRCEGLAWLMRWQDCEVGEVTNDKTLSHIHWQQTVLSGGGKRCEFRRIELEGFGAGFERTS